MESSARIRVFRAVSQAELRQILRTGKFEIVPWGVEGKYFADTVEGARRFGELLLGDGNFGIVEADVPVFAPSLYRWTNLDGCGPARFLHMCDLQEVHPRVWNEEPANE